MAPNKKKQEAPQSITEKLTGAGVTVTDKGTAIIRDRQGDLIETSQADALDRIARKGAAPETITSKAARKSEAQRAKRVEGFGEGARAFGEGALRSLTLGASKLFEGEDAGLRQEFRGGLSAAGELTGALVGVGTLFNPQSIARFTPLGQLTKFSVGAGKKAGGGLVGALVENGVEGGAFQFAQTATDLMVTDKPLTAESVASQLISNTLIGAVTGVAAGGVAYGAQKAGQRLVRSNLHTLESFGEFAGAAKKQAQIADDILKRPVSDSFVDISKPKAKGGRLGANAVTGAGFRPRSKVLDEAVREAEKAASAFKKAAGVKKGGAVADGLDSLGKISSREDLLRVGRAYDDYIKNARRVAELKGVVDDFDAGIGGLKSAYTKLAQDIDMDPKASVSDMLALAFEGTQIAELATGQDIIPTGNPAVEALMKLWAIQRIAGGKSVASKLFADKLGKQIFKGSVGRAAARAAADAAADAGVGGLGRAAAAGGAAVIGRRAAADFVDMGINGLLKSQNGTKARIAESVGKFLNKGSKLLRAPAKSVNSRFLASLVDDEEKKDNRTEQISKLVEIAGSPDKTRAKVESLSGPMAGLNGDMKSALDEILTKAMLHLAEKAPKDPGVLSTFGRSRWQPSQSQWSEFMRHVRVAEDPISVFEDLVDGRISPQAVETLKALYPATFADWQRNIADNVEELSKLPYSDQIRIGTLSDVAVNPMQSITGKLQQTYASEEEARQQSQQLMQKGAGGGGLQSPAESLQEPTTAQQLREKRF